MDFILLVGLIVLVFVTIGLVRRKNKQTDLQLAAAKAPPTHARTRPAPMPLADKYSLLERAQKLKENGTLTEEEFAAEKTRILNAANPAPASSANAALQPEEQSLIHTLATYGYQTKAMTANTWRISEPLGGKLTVTGIDDLLDYVNGVVGRAGR